MKIKMRKTEVLHYVITNKKENTVRGWFWFFCFALLHFPFLTSLNFLTVFFVDTYII